MLSKTPSKKYDFNTNQKILIIYLSETAKHCYKLHLEKNQDKKNIKPTLVAQLQSVGNWQSKELVLGWMSGFQNTIRKHLIETISNDVNKLLIITKKSINKTKDSLNDEEKQEIPSHIKLYGVIYSYIKEVCRERIGSTKHFKYIEYPSKKELTLLSNDLSSFFEIDINLTDIIRNDIWNNQK